MMNRAQKLIKNDMPIKIRKYTNPAKYFVMILKVEFTF
jgi:hypothetical protein